MALDGYRACLWGIKSCVKLDGLEQKNMCGTLNLGSGSVDLDGIGQTSSDRVTQKASRLDHIATCLYLQPLVTALHTCHLRPGLGTQPSQRTPLKYLLPKCFLGPSALLQLSSRCQRGPLNMQKPAGCGHM
jgi:hypothetical protein